MLESAFGWIGQIASWLGEFIPRWTVVDTRHGAIKWRAFRMRDVLRLRFPGMVVVVYPPGSFAMFWPMSTLFELYPVAYQTVPLVSQDIVTKDDITVTARGVLAYEITDLEKILAHTWDPEDTIKDIAGSSFHDVICRFTWDELKRGQGRTLDTALRNEAKKDLGDRGVLVHKFTLNSLARSRVIRLVQSQSQEGER